MRISLLWIVLVYSNLVFGQKMTKNDSVEVKTDNYYIRLKTENDFWITDSKSDRYFSNGMRLEFQMPQTWFSNRWLRKGFISLPTKKYQKTKIFALAEMRMYTPENLEVKTPIIGDRPYAGTLTFGLGGVSTDFVKGERVTTEYQIGVIGPAAKQKEVQIAWHNYYKRHNPKVVIPEGWDNQIANLPALNVRVEYEKNIFSPVRNIETISGFEMNFGTVTNYIGLNNQFRLGLFNDYFFNSSGLKMRNKFVNGQAFPTRKTFYSENINRDFQAYFFVKSSFRFALHNTLLQGGFFENQNNVYTIPSDALRRLYLNGEFGFAMAFKKFALIYTQLFRSPEFVTAKQSRWGALTIVVGLGRG